MGSLERSSHFTSKFLPYSPDAIWVQQLEDVNAVVAHSWWARLLGGNSPVGGGGYQGLQKMPIQFHACGMATDVAVRLWV
jgi:hypothetical protein